MFVVIEGIDGCGKETQIKKLMEEADYQLFKYPTHTFSVLNDYLEKKISIDSKSLFLLFLADIANEQEKIKKAMKNGVNVVADRYVFSTIAYELNSISYDQAKKIVSDINFIKPDKVVLLDIDAKTSQQRKKKQKKLDRYEENAKYLEFVRTNFIKLYNDKFLANEWHKIDATKSIDEIYSEISRIVYYK